MPRVSDTEYKKLSEKNARHSALLHIESGNASKIAEALKDMETMKALQFLFEQAEKHRRLSKYKKTATILEAAKLIDRKTGEITELTLQSKGLGKNEVTELGVEQYELV